MQSVLIVEDRDSLRQLYAQFLRRMGYQVLESRSAEQADGILQKQEISVILLDYMLPGMNGLEFLKKIRQCDPDMRIIIMTAFGEVKLAVQAMREGAFEFLEKPIDLEFLNMVVERALEHRSLRRKAEFNQVDAQWELVGASKQLADVIDLADRVASSETTCLILGESGTGKELLAHRIHQRSSRSQGPFVSLNCASIPSELIESELFGHEKGAFTGASQRKLGLLEMANGGSLFLDEIGELHLNLQPKLLRVVQEKEFRRVGGRRVISADLRLICATNRDLLGEVREGRFREDLYYRVAPFPLTLPPLRDRLDDMAQLIPHFLKKFGSRLEGLDDEAMQRLMQYPWPGNVRELENTLERAVVLCGDGPITLAHLPPQIALGRVHMSIGIDLSTTYKENMKRVASELELQMIHLLMKRYKGNREKVAKQLGMSIKTLYNHLKKHNEG